MDNLQLLFEGKTDDYQFLKQYDVLKLFKAFLPYMTHKDDNIRGRATNILLKIFSEDYEIQDNQKQVLIQFFTQKLIDQYSQLDSIEILRILLEKSQQQNKKQLVQQFLDGIRKMAINTMVRESRINMYRIFLNIIDENLTPELAQYIIRQLGGEKDPRNIIVAFQIIKQLLEQKDVIHLYTTDIINFLDCYYPIEMVDNPNKKAQEHKLMIIDLLDDCLCSPIITNKTLNLLEEKVTSTYDRGQACALNTLKKLILKVQVNQQEFIWDILQKHYELIDDENTDIYADTIKTLILNSKSDKLRDKIIMIYLKWIKEVPLSKQAYIGGQILPEIEYSINQLIDQFIQLFNISDIQVAQVRANLLLKCLMNNKRQLNDDLIENILTRLNKGIQAFQDNLTAICLKSAMIICTKQNYPELKLIKEFLCVQFTHQSIVIQKCTIDFYLHFQIYDDQQFIEQIQNSKLQQEVQIYSYPLLFFSQQDQFLQIINQILTDLALKDPKTANLMLIRINYFLNHYKEQIQQYSLGSIVTACYQIYKNLQQFDYKDKFVRQQLKQLTCSLYQYQASSLNDIIQFQILFNWQDNINYYFKDCIDILSSDSLLKFKNQIIQIISEGEVTLLKQIENRQYLSQFIELVISKDINLIETLFQIIQQNNQISNTQQQCYYSINSIIIRQGLRQSVQSIYNYVIQNIQIQVFPFIFNKLLQKSKDQQKTQYLIISLINQENYNRYIFNQLELSTIDSLQSDQKQIIANYLLNVNGAYDEYIDLDREFDITIYLFKSINNGTLELLLQMLDSKKDIQQLEKILHLIGNNDEVQYNKQLQLRTTSTLKQLLDHPKRIVRVAAQKALSNLYLI
ncbi:hypothetical protein pb186bvf_015382 [Paramecium bursaria]